VGLRNIAGKSGADYLRIVGGFSLRRGKKGVSEVATSYCGQLSGKTPATSPHGEFPREYFLPRTARRSVAIPLRIGCESLAVNLWVWFTPYD